jgi:hypothetical protein
VLLRHPISRAFYLIAMALAFGRSSAPAQQPQLQPTVSVRLARAGCEIGTALNGNVGLDTGYIAMLGVGEKAYSFRVMRDGARVLMIPAEQCSDPRPIESRPFILILSHSFQNENRVREAYHYLMNQHGQLVTAVHFQDGRSHLFAYTNPDVPVRRADFEAEKDIWISKIAESATLRRVRHNAD